MLTDKHIIILRAALQHFAEELDLEDLDAPDEREPLMVDWDRLEGRFGRAITRLTANGFAA